MRSVRPARLLPMPVLAIAQRVSAAPPAPAVGSSRVAAAPPNVISVLARRSRRGVARAADEPEQRDVAAEGEELGDGGEDDPRGVGRQGAGERVGQDAERAAGEEHDRDGHHGEREGERGAPGDQSQVERGEGEVRGDRGVVGGDHAQKYPVAAGPAVHRGCP